MKIKIKFTVGAVMLFTFLVFAQESEGMFTDSRDGQTYRYVVMPDGKTWMAENLNFETDSGSWCYDDVVANCDIYGRLYDWNTALTVCPAGWRLPSNVDWEILVAHPSGSWIAGTKLKSQSGWYDNGNGTDNFGFSALPGGYRWSVGGFGDVDRRGCWWTATELDATDARSWYMVYDGEGVEWGWGNKSSGFSVRCVRDD